MDAPVFPPDDQVQDPQTDSTQIEAVSEDQADSGVAPAKAAPRVNLGILGQLLNTLFYGFRQSAEEDQWRFNALTLAIERDPDAASSYVLRGELLLEKGEVALAQQDFAKGLELAEPRAESAGWGYIYRALSDRAKEGLRACRKVGVEDAVSS